jgi:hypothetical protein
VRLDPPRLQFQVERPAVVALVGPGRLRPDIVPFRRAVEHRGGRLPLGGAGRLGDRDGLGQAVPVLGDRVPRVT